MREFFIRTQKIRWISFTILISVVVIMKQQDVGYILFRVFIVSIMGYYFESLMTSKYDDLL